MAHAQENSQANLFSAAEEAALYHTNRFGFFTLNTKRGDKMRQSAHRLDQLATVIPLIDPSRDTWISQGEFNRPNRRVVNLERIGLLFVDLDYYHSAFSHLSPDAVLWAIWHFLDDQGLPLPSVVIDSGQGMQLKWILNKPIPSQALPRWNACQAALVNALERFGADPRAKDASRILRVVQTTNTKNGRLVEVLHAPNFTYDFDEIADQILPYTRGEIEEFRRIAKEKREAKEQNKPAKQQKQQRQSTQLKLIEGGIQDQKRGLNKFSGKRLAWDRLNDIRLLAQLRGGVREGERMQHLFWQLNFLLLSGATNSNQMWYEACELSRQIDPHWKTNQSDLSTLFRKAKEHESGQKVEFQGVEYPPLYTPKNQTLIDLFQIEPEEERQLKTIVSRSVKLERHREREEIRRREAGAVKREVYEATAQEKREKAKALRDKGFTWSQVAKEVGYKNGKAARMSVNKTV